MKKSIIFILASIISVIGFSQTKAGRIDNTKHPVFYTCSENSTIITRELGKCPLCGMDLKLSPKEQVKAQVVKSYACPLYVSLSLAKPGLSPKEEMKWNTVIVSANSNTRDTKNFLARQ